MSERLTRKDIKRDEFVEALESSVSWLERHTKLLIASAVGVVVLIAAGFGIWWWLDVRAANASAALDLALEVYRAPVGADAAGLAGDEPSFSDEAARRQRSKELFEAVADGYGSSDAAAVATVFLGQIAADEGDLDRARELWTKAVGELGDVLLCDQVRVNLLHLDRQQGRSEQVAIELEGMLADEKRPLPADLVLWELAATYERLDRDADAESAYRRLSEEYPASAYAAQASSKLPPQEGDQEPLPSALGGFGGLG